MLKTVEKVLLLQDLVPFRKASTEHLIRLAGIARTERVSPGTEVFSRGDLSVDLHFLVDGRIRLTNAGGAAETVERGALDLASVLSEAPHSVTAEALEESTLLVVSFEELLDILTAEADFCWILLRHFAEQGRRQAEAGNGRRAQEKDPVDTRV